jgi:photosystem II stability/assembly factor-like uncharacterized protein
MRKRLPQLLGLAIILLLSFTLLPAPAQAKADAWTRYPIPQKGEAGGWVLTSDVGTEGTGVTAICVAYDGTIYAATDETSGSPLNGYNLFKSTDDGYTWTPLWKIPAGDKPAGGPVSDPNPKIIALLLPRWEYPDTLYLATQYNVYKSTDGGENFTTVGGRPTYGGGADPARSRLITSLDVTYYHNNHLVLVGSGDADAGDYGGIYFYDESKIFTPWLDLRVGGGDAGTKYDVLDVAFSPNFADDMQVVALVTNETNTLVTTKLGSSDWGATIGDATMPGVVATGGCLAFPADYDSGLSEDKYIQYVGLDIAGVAGAIYMVIGVEKPNAPIAAPMFASAAGVHSMAVTGEAYNATIVAGLTDGNVICSTTGAIWHTAYTPPSVTATATDTCVALGGFYSSGYIVYAGTSSSDGTIRKNCGFARSVDSGDTFAQTAFICDDLKTIIDLAVSPNYANDGTIYMITEGNSGNLILWRTTNSGETWDAVLTEGQGITLPSGSMVNVPKFDKVAISPHFASDTTVFIREKGIAPDIWRSTDNGFHFSPLLSRSGTTGTINSWAMVNNREILVGDSLGDFYKTTNGGRTWSPAVATGLSSFSSMALSPDYDRDSTILAGGGGGEVYLSTDGGETWQALAETGLTKFTVVAFAPNYTDNKTVYAADYGAGAKAGVMRFVVGTSTTWERIDDTSPTRIEEVGASTSAGIRGMVASDDGNGLSTLYVTDPNPVVPRQIGTTPAEGSVARCLNPTGALSPATEAPVFEIVNTDLSAGVKLSGLWHAQGSHTLWSVDTASTPMVLYTYEDTLTLSLELASPDNGACSGRQTSGEVSWNSITSASSYNLWYDTAPSFRQSPTQLYSQVAKANITGLDSGITYYWRVRVGRAGSSTCVPGTTITFGAPTLSRFSTGWSFTTALGGAQWSPLDIPAGVAPSPGATNVPVRPTFAWNPADGASGYEFVLARDGGFSDVVIALTDANALSNTVWACSQDLAYNTTYFWRVRAISATSQSRWGVGVFTTEAAPSAPPQPPPPPLASPSQPGTPIYFWVALGVGIALVVVVLGFILRRRL